MKKIILSCLLAILCPLLTLAEPTDILATYKGGKITAQDVMQQFQAELDNNPKTKNKKFAELDKKMQELLVKNYIAKILFEKEAREQKISNSKEYKQKVKMLEDQVAVQLLINNYVKSKVTEDAIKKEYDVYVMSVKGNKEVKTRHILFTDADKAKKAHQELVNSKDKNKKFIELVDKFSADPSAKRNKGEIGYTMRGYLAPEYESKAFAMKKNEISEPVKTDFGWHIIQLLDRRDAKPSPLAEIRDSITNNLSNQAIQTYLKELEKKDNLQMKKPAKN